jgi:outer membrane immunogenic protein
MKKLLLLVSCVATLTLIWVGLAPAADMPIKAVRATVAVVPTWDGGYVGGYVGAQQGKSDNGVDGWTDSQTNVVPGQTNPVQDCYYKGEGDSKTLVCKDSKHQFITTGPTNVSSSTSYPAVANSGNVIGVTFGAYGGYNKQLNQGIVVGVELDGGWSGARDYNTIYAVTANHKMPWNFNLTGRLGILPTSSMDTLVYLKAGMAVQQQQSWLSGPSGAASADNTKVGWTAGVGIEHKINQRLSARVEGMYSKVSDQTISIPGAISTLSGASWNAKAGLAWSFN